MAIESRNTIDSHLDSSIISGLSSPISGNELNATLKKITESFYNKVDDPFTDNEYSIFCIWAEESNDLDAGAQQWSFGSGNETPQTCGVVIPIACELFAMGLNVEASEATVRTVVNGDINLSDYQVSATSPSDFATFSSSLQINPGDVVNFRTISSSGNSTDSGRVSAFFRIKTSSLSTSTLSDLVDTCLLYTSDAADD